jgi:hypothetical protein
VPKKKRQNYQSFQSINGGRLIALYFDMLDSEAWRELKGNDIKVYMYMLRKYTASYTKGMLVNCNKDNISIPKNEYLGKDKKQPWIMKIGRSTFINAIDNLIDLGFIKVVKSGYAARECNIYGFNDMWKFYGTDKFYIKNEWRRPSKKLY